jgi:hypothetical protein
MFLDTRTAPTSRQDHATRMSNIKLSEHGRARGLRLQRDGPEWFPMLPMPPRTDSTGDGGASKATGRAAPGSAARSRSLRPLAAPRRRQCSGRASEQHGHKTPRTHPRRPGSREASIKQFVSSTSVRDPVAILRQSIRDSARRPSARAPRIKSFRKATKSRAISTASRSLLDAPSDSRASSSSRGSSQKALRTFPTRLAR